VSAEESTEARATRDALVGDLAHQVSVLVRKDLELAAVQRAPEIRRRLLRRLGKGAHEQVLSDAIVERELAKQEVRTTTNELRQELRREARERERQLLSDAEQRVDRAAERDFEALLKEILGVLGAPGRVGINLLERLVAGTDAEHRDAGTARP
jgi:hypothetical protein